LLRRLFLRCNAAWFLIMELRHQVSRKLHDEHVAIIDLLGRFGRALESAGAAPPGTEDSAWRTLLSQLDAALQYEVGSHFDLEETQLFPRLHERGEGDLAELLFEDHEEIRPVVRALLERIGAARAGTLDAAGWRSFRASGLELVERLGSHAQKEQDALVPLVDEMLDDATDEEIWTLYAS
jgi:DUF438 domain-containing protein